MMKINDKEIVDWLKWKYNEGDVINMRIKKRDGTAINELLPHFDNETVERIIRYIGAMDNDTIMAYWTNLQHIDPKYDPKAFDDKAGKANGKGVKDKDIDKISCVGIDLDAIIKVLDKDGNYNSSAAEMADALAVTNEIVSYLDAFGWPKPCIKASGNGGQLEYPADIAIEDVWTYERFLEGLGGKYDPLGPQAAKLAKAKRTETEEQRIERENKLYEVNLKRRADVDSTLSNPGRMIKVAGTPTRKANHTEERPQRTSYLISLPEKSDKRVTKDMMLAVLKDLEKYLPATTTEPSDEGKTEEVDAYTKSCGYVEWFIEKHGIKIAKVEEDAKYKKYILAANTCPNASAHTHEDGDGGSSSLLMVLKQESEYIRDGKPMKSKKGAVFYKCHHDHCDGFGWYDFKASYDQKFALTRRITEKTGASKDGQISDNSYLVEMLSEYQTVKDTSGQMYVIVDDQHDGLKILDAGGREFMSILSKQFCDLLGKAASMKAMKEALLVKYAETHEVRRLAVRVNAEHMDDDQNRTIWYDLCDDNGNAVKITKDAVTLMKKPLIFKNNGWQAPQVIPDLVNGDVTRFYELLDMNISSEEPETVDNNGVDITRTSEYEQELAEKQRDIADIKLLMATYLVYQYIPDTPEHPVSKIGMNINGAPGSGKTELTSGLQNLVDPVGDDVTRKPSKMADLELLLACVYYACLDNINELGQDESDLICGCATGTTVTKRVLYFDTDMIRLRIKLGVLLNGIASIIKKSDAARRYMFLYLNPLSASQYKPEAYIDSRYKTLRPIILGGVFKTLQKALAAYPTMKDAPALKAGLSSMASFDEWGYVIAEQIEPNGGGKRFLDTYKRLSTERDMSMVGESLVCTAVVEYMSGINDTGTMQMPRLRENLWTILTDPAGLNTPKRKLEEFPGTSSELKKELLTVRANLQALGLDVKVKQPAREKGGRNNRAWSVRIRRINAD